MAAVKRYWPGQDTLAQSSSQPYHVTNEELKQFKLPVSPDLLVLSLQSRES